MKPSKRSALDFIEELEIKEYQTFEIIDAQKEENFAYIVEGLENFGIVSKNKDYGIAYEIKDVPVIEAILKTLKIEYETRTLYTLECEDNETFYEWRERQKRENEIYNELVGNY